MRNSAGAFFVEHDSSKGYQVLDLPNRGGSTAVFGYVADADGDGRDEILAGASQILVVSDVR